MHQRRPPWTFGDPILSGHFLISHTHTVQTSIIIFSKYDQQVWPYVYMIILFLYDPMMSYFYTVSIIFLVWPTSMIIFLTYSLLSIILCFALVLAHEPIAGEHSLACSSTARVLAPQSPEVPHFGDLIMMSIRKRFLITPPGTNFQPLKTTN